MRGRLKQEPAADGTLFRPIAGALRRLAAVAYPCDATSLAGAVDAAEQGLLEPILVGPEHRIRGVAEAEKLDISPYRLVATKHSHESAEKAVALVRAGETSMLMKGSLHTDELMHRSRRRKPASAPSGG